MDMMKSYQLWPLLIQYIYLLYSYILFVESWKLMNFCFGSLLLFIYVVFFCFRCFLCSSSIHLSIYLYLCVLICCSVKQTIHPSREKKKSARIFVWILRYCEFKPPPNNQPTNYPFHFIQAIQKNREKGRVSSSSTDKRM